MSRHLFSNNLGSHVAWGPMRPASVLHSVSGAEHSAALLAPAAPRSWSRRLLSGALALLPLAVATQAQAQVAAKSADSFVESIGINVHWEYDSYGNYAGLKAKLGASGIRYMRDGSTPNIHGKLNDLYTTYGIRTNVLLGRRFAGGWPQPLDPSQIGAELTNVKGITAGAVASLEGPNEYDISHGGGETNWVGKIQQYTKDTYTQAKADATLRNLPIIGPSFTSEGAYVSVGSQDASIDFANIHLYQSDRNPGIWGWGSNGYGSLSWGLDYMAKRQSPSGKPAQSTECGYHNDYGNDGLSEEAEGKYTARMYAEFFRRGVARSYKYELINQWGGTYKEEVFGLLRNDLTEKPSYRAVKNLISVLSDKGASFTPGSLNYTLTGNTDEVRQMLFQKRNGDFYLMLWVEKPSWDVNANTNLYPASQNVTLGLPGGITAATKYELTNNSDLSTNAVAISNNALSLAVSDKIMIIKLVAGTTTTLVATAPDLIVTDIAWSPATPVVGDALTFSATIKNQGTGATPAGTVHGVGFWVDGVKTTWSDNSTAALAAGASRTVTGTGPRYTLTAGPHTVEAFVDDANRISNESNETNNKLSETLAASTPTAPVASGFSGVYRLVARHSGKVLDVSGGTSATGNGAQVHQWDNVGGANQQWAVTATGNGYYKLTAQHSGKVLDVSASSTADGATVHQWEDNGSTAQRWQIEPTSDGYYKLTAQCSGKVLDIAGGPSAMGNGAAAIQWSYGGGANQQWKLEQVSAGRAASASALKVAPVAAAAATPVAASLIVYPNPNHGEATLGLEAQEAQRVTVYVHNAQGNLVSLFTVPTQAGHTDFHVPTTLAPGTYYLRTLVDGQKQTLTLKVE